MENIDELFTAQDIAWLGAKGITLNAAAPAALLAAPSSTGVVPPAAPGTTPARADSTSGAGPATLAMGLFLLLMASRLVVLA
jgi:hypothetical protein